MPKFLLILSIIFLYSSNSNAIDDNNSPKYWFIGQSGREVSASYMPKDVNTYNWFAISVDLPFYQKPTHQDAMFTITKIAQPTSFTYPPLSLETGKGWGFGKPIKDKGFIIGVKNGFIPTGEIKGFFFQMRLGEKQSFEFQNTTYTVAINGKRDFKKEKQLDEALPYSGIVAKNFTLTLNSRNKAGKIISQKIFVDSSHYSETNHNIWMADFNGDNIPDIITPIKNSTSGYDMALFISYIDKQGNVHYRKSHYQPCSC